MSTTIRLSSRLSMTFLWAAVGDFVCLGGAIEHIFAPWGSVFPFYQPRRHCGTGADSPLMLLIARAPCTLPPKRSTRLLTLMQAGQDIIVLTA